MTTPSQAVAEALHKLVAELTCPMNGNHYCPNCDRSLFDALEIARAALASADTRMDGTKGENMDTTTLGRFGHHPDPAIDFCVEVECLEGLFCDIKAGPQEKAPVAERIEKAMSFIVGGDIQAINAKALLRKLEEQIKAPAPAEEVETYTFHSQNIGSETSKRVIIPTSAPRDLEGVVERLRKHPTRLQTFRPLLDEAATLIEEMRKALEPFAKEAGAYDPPENDDCLMMVEAEYITRGDLRRARSLSYSKPMSKSRRLGKR